MRYHSLYCGAFNGPVPCKARRTLERHRLLALDDINPLRDIGVRRSPGGPSETKRAPRAPMPRKTLERHEPLARNDISPLRDIGVRRSPRGPSEPKRAPQAPMPRKTLERHEPLARNNINPLKRHRREKVARGPLETRQAPQAPMPRCAADQRLEGWLAQTPRRSQTQRRGRPDAASHGPTDQRFEA
jgi:hypothetical protein